MFAPDAEREKKAHTTEVVMKLEFNYLFGRGWGGGEERRGEVQEFQMFILQLVMCFVSRIFDANTPYNCMLLQPGCCASSLSSQGLGA
jgi:hypothetical protein